MALETTGELPIVEELDPVPDVFAALSAVNDLPKPVLFESAQHHSRHGRYSFLAADPVEFIQIQRVEYRDDPLAELRLLSAQYAGRTIPELPPFQGGFAGVFSYELGHAWERLPRVATDDFHYPALAVGCYDWVVCWDHFANRAWIISHGFPEINITGRMRRARERIAEIKERLQSRPVVPESQTLSAPEFDSSDSCPESNFTRDEYVTGVQRVIDYIRAGDIFQANLTQRFIAPFQRSSLELYQNLRATNPAPFAGYFQSDDWALASASPERFIQLIGKQIFTRPIKGTRRRVNRPEADLFRGDELKHSEKDRAENVMIVDLLRNDLSRVCRPGSVKVTELCTVENFETVQHLVSEVIGELDAGRSFWDVWPAVFPGGSITGAPKIRAMEIIAELEQLARGPYCGTLFYHGFDGRSDSNILIRTFLVSNGTVQYSAGGGIVADSDPLREYEETLDKALGMRLSLKTVGESQEKVCEMPSVKKLRL